MLGKGNGQGIPIIIPTCKPRRPDNDTEHAHFWIKEDRDLYYSIAGPKK